MAQEVESDRSRLAGDVTSDKRTNNVKQLNRMGTREQDPWKVARATQRRNKLARAGALLEALRVSKLKPPREQYRWDYPGWTQMDLAFKVLDVRGWKIDPAQIGRIERGEIEPSRDEILDLAKALEADAYDTALLLEAYEYTGGVDSLIVREHSGGLAVIACFDAQFEGDRVERRTALLQALQEARAKVRLIIEAARAEHTRKVSGLPGEG